MALKISCLGSCYFGTHSSELTESLNSIFLGAVRVDQVVLVVDGPIPDHLDAIVKHFEELYSLDLLRLNRNYGLGMALSQGLTICDNEIIARYDTDDISSSERFLLQFSFLVANPFVSCVGSDVFEFHEIATSYFVRKKSVPKNARLGFWNFLCRNPINHPTVMFRKSHVIACGGYENVPLFEDYYLWLKMLASGYILCNLKGPPLVYMRRQTQGLRRTGYDYLVKELRFSLLIFKLNQPFWIYSLFFCFRAFLKYLVPLHCIRMPWRESWKSSAIAPWHRAFSFLP